MKRFFALILTLFVSLLHAKEEGVDLVVFSFDRPMQLYAFLESTEKYITHLNQTHAIVRASNDDFRHGYSIVSMRFPQVHVHYQEQKKPYDFKSLVMKTAFNEYSKCPFVMFAVDDMIVTEQVNLAKCTRALSQDEEVWFFSLRLGENITHCGRLNRAQKVPPGKKVGSDMFVWRFRDVEIGGDWNYPNTTDLTIYRKNDLHYLFSKLEFTNPNTLEQPWSRYRPKRGRGLSFDHSKAINIPMNVVNPHFSSPNMNITTEELLRLFLTGKKIDIDQFAYVDNNSPHVDYQPTFISR